MSFEQLKDSMHLHPKPIMIKIYTDWCAICKIQNKQFNKDKEIMSKLSTKYYFVELNAEAKKTILFNQKTYKYIPNGLSSGLHELAFYLGNNNGQLAYPTWVMLSSNYEIIGQYNGLLKAEDIKKVL
ncbi:thioredoxin family protein [Flavobacterium sp. '19STA2R22 D10 B1']|uniref:thioredoxin family protein n=1 Tax=Flavobacterium aerium TaxID=3037261 RepID=UPI00278BDC27|nr:thioredoxin fold domain-containing protein [Flavobacterium sp. '19STA2R22 D10 B1']